MKARVLLDRELSVSERFRVELKVFEVGQSKKFPSGIKVSFALIDVIEKTPRLLIDNHAPFGFHVHSELPKRPKIRRELKMDDYQDALDEFWRLVKGIIEDED